MAVGSTGGVGCKGAAPLRLGARAPIAWVATSEEEGVALPLGGIGFRSSGDAEHSHAQPAGDWEDVS